MVVVTFLAVLAYDALFKSNLGKDLKVGATIGFVLTTVVLLGFILAGFSYRAYVIHTGTMFGTIMAFNVWMRIWPAQQKIIRATKEGQAPDAALVALAGSRSRHNTYLSVPLVWAMINSHTVTFANPLYLLLAILAGWGAVHLCYKKAASVKGF
jgi:uncharacterized membrane protein